MLDELLIEEGSVIEDRLKVIFGVIIELSDKIGTIATKCLNSMPSLFAELF